jgi:4a-hydroxytetrahydrobiopterin dehydratase
MPRRVFEICIDANDPARLRPFWGLVLGYAEQVTGEGAVDLVDPEGVGPTVWFQKVPERKAMKNRVHHDVSSTAGNSTAWSTSWLVSAVRSSPFRRGSSLWLIQKATRSV